METQLLESMIEPIYILKEGEEAETCEYFNNGCNIPKNRICFKGYSKHCRTKSFLNKYGTEYLNSNRWKKNEKE